MSNQDIQNYNEEDQKEILEMEHNENKINETFEKTNHNKEILKKLEKHLSTDNPILKYYDNIKYRGSSVIGLNFYAEKYMNRFYSRRKIDEIGNDISTFLQAQGARKR